MRDLEKLLEEKMKDLTPHEQETLNMLARDIKFSKQEKRDEKFW